MKDAVQAKIFLSGERGLTETNWFRSYYTFNYGSYQHEHKKPFGPLYVLNDDTLAGERTLRFLVEDDSDVILLPTVGAVVFKYGADNDALVDAGGALFHSASANSSFTITNPYEDELVNCLQLWIKRQIVMPSTKPRVIAFELEKAKNGFIELFPFEKKGIAGVANARACIGKFDGRQEAVYKIEHPENGVFLFVLEGAFEIQNRLLEGRDGLALRGTAEVELEALSNDAILLLIELAGVDKMKM